MAESELKNLQARTLTGIVFLILVSVSVFFSEYSFLFIFGLVSIGCLHEFYKLIKTIASPQYALGMIFGISLYILNGMCLLNIVPEIQPKFLLFSIVFSVILFVAMIFDENKRPFTNVAFTILGIIYCVMPFICLQYLGINPANQQYTYKITLGFLLMIWTNDSAAFASGKLFGKTKLAKNISPGKTIEGTIGGAVGAFIVCYILMNQWKVLENGITMTYVDWMIVWGITVAFGVLGDLSESKLKRSLQIKNSSNFFPGHGGFLDRFDSVFLSAPLLFVYFMFFKY